MFKFITIFSSVTAVEALRMDGTRFEITVDGQPMVGRNGYGEVQINHDYNFEEFVNQESDLNQSATMKVPRVKGKFEAFEGWYIFETSVHENAEEGQKHTKMSDLKKYLKV